MIVDSYFTRKEKCLITLKRAVLVRLRLTNFSCEVTHSFVSINMLPLESVPNNSTQTLGFGFTWRSGGV